MILTVLGGSAFSTPLLAQALARSAESTVTLRLAGRNPRRLNAVDRACRVLCAGSALGIESYELDEWPAAIDGSDVVLVQMRVGGYEGRAFDERFPLAHDVPGDEGLGPGGLSAAYRAWPQIAASLRQVQAQAPSSRIILLSSPGSLLVRLTATMFPGCAAAHVCELPLTTLRSLARTVGVRLPDTEFDYVGVNHLGWLFNIRSQGRDVIKEYIAKHNGDDFPSATLVSELQAIPLSYLRLHYHLQEVLREQRAAARCRAEELQCIAAHAFEVFERGSRAAIAASLRARRVDWYREAVVPLIRTWLGESVATPVFLTCSTRAPSVVERRYASFHGEYREVPQRASPSLPIETTIARFTAYEALAAAAVLDGSPNALTEALAAHPWVGTSANPMCMATQIIENSRAHREVALDASWRN